MVLAGARARWFSKSSKTHTSSFCNNLSIELLLSVAAVFVSTLNSFYGNENDPNLRKHDVPVILDEQLLDLFRKSDSSTVFIFSSCITVISESPLRSSSSPVHAS
jgi:hypothetical protein